MHKGDVATQFESRLAKKLTSRKYRVRDGSDSQHFDPF